MKNTILDATFFIFAILFIVLVIYHFYAMTYAPCEYFQYWKMSDVPARCLELKLNK